MGTDWIPPVLFVGLVFGAFSAGWYARGVAMGDVPPTGVPGFASEVMDPRTAAAFRDALRESREVSQAIAAARAARGHNRRGG